MRRSDRPRDASGVRDTLIGREWDEEKRNLPLLILGLDGIYTHIYYYINIELWLYSTMNLMTLIKYLNFHILYRFS